MFDAVSEFVAGILSAIYDVVGNYAIAIAILTLLAMIVTTPFTLKGTRSMIQMQRLQPEMRKLQIQYKDDRQKLNEELMAFYKENNLSPLGGCLPLLLQMPIFIVLYRTLNGLLSRGEGGTFVPDHLDKGTKLYEDLFGAREMVSFGVDLAESASKSLGDGFVHGVPHLILVAIVAVTGYYQQRQIQGRNPNQEMPQQQQILMKIMPLFLVFFSFVAPSALVIYFVVSNLFRIGQQFYITRSLYHGEDSLGAQAQRAAAEARALAKEHGGNDLLPRVGKRAKAAEAATGAATPSPTAAKATKAPTTGSGAGNGAKQPPAPTSRTTSPNRSKKKKKRR